MANRLTLLWLFVVAGMAYADISSRLNIRTENAAVNTYPYQARFTNGTVTDNGDGTVSITSGGGGSTTLNATAVGFGSVTNTVTGDASTFHWDNTTKTLYINSTAAAAEALDLQATAGNFYLYSHISTDDTLQQSIVTPFSSMNFGVAGSAGDVLSGAGHGDAFMFAGLNFWVSGTGIYLNSPVVSMPSLTASQFIKTDASKNFATYDLFAGTNVWTAPNSFVSSVTIRSSMTVVAPITSVFVATFATSTVMGNSPQGVFITTTVLMVGTTIPAGTERLNVNGVGNFTGARISGVSGTQGVTISGNGGISSTGGASLDLGGLLGGNVGANLNLTGQTRAVTSGTNQQVLVGGGFSPTSGTGVMNTLQIQDTVTQSGGANGITRSLLITPTLTRAADYRAIETSAYTINLPITYTVGNLMGNLINTVTVSTNVAMTFPQFALLNLGGPGVAASSSTITNDYSLLISSVNALQTGVGVGAGAVTNSYGLAVFGSTSATNNYSAIFMNKPVGIGTNFPGSLLQLSSGTLTIDGNVSPALTVRGSGAPPDSQALCLLNGQLGHCTTIVGATGGCTCSVP